MKHKILKHCNIFNIIILNIFVAGFILNFFAFSQTNWIKNDNYIYGVFQYCTANQIIRIDDSYSFYDQIEVFYRKYTSDNDIRCFKWSRYTTPKFISYSFILQSVGLSAHLVVIIIIIILKIINHKLNNCYRHQFNNSKNIDKNIKVNCCLKVSYHIAWNFFFCFVSTGATAIFGANLVIFQYHQNLTSIKINNESLSWSYWISVGGTSATFIATCALLIYTVYFKYLNNGEERKFGYSVKYFIDAYKKCNGPLYSINFDEQFKPHIHSSFTSRDMQFNKNDKTDTKNTDNKEQKATIRTVHNETIENAYDNPVTENVFFRINPDLNDESKMSEVRITHKSEIIDSCKSVSDIESKVDDSAAKTTQPPPQPQPTSFIYSQVYPSGKKEKNSKDSTLKMVVLPYGSLSGTCATNSKNEATTQEPKIEDRQI